MHPSENGARADLIEVAVALPVYATFTYQVPPALLPAIGAGIRVLVPFGRRRVTAYVLKTAARPPDAALKSIAAVLDDQPIFPPSMIAFFEWIADYYIHPLGEVLQTGLPAGINTTERTYYALSDTGQKELATRTLAPPQQAVFQRLAQGPCRLIELRRLAGASFPKTALKTWEQKQWVVRQDALIDGRTRPKTTRFVLPGPPLDPGGRLSPVRQTILAVLKDKGPIGLDELKTLVPTAADVVRAMARDNQVVLEQRLVYRDPLGAPIMPDRPPTLSAEQQSALDTMSAALGRGYRAFLLAGVTGSGKTEVYLHMADKALQQGLSVLVLVPEIALISQIERAFRARFGQCVALLHSGLSDGERLDQWQRILRCEATIAVGARSAIFAPFERIGLIIVDEEHDDSYKQEGALHYNARDLAVVRAQQHGAVAILGSATPSLQSAYNALNGKFQKISLFERVEQRAMPRIVIEDLTAAREERGIRRHFMPALIEAMQETLARKEQVLLFLNRRGFSNVLVCAACGQVLRCARCDISLTYHQKTNAYLCHYCGFSRAAVASCGKCGSKRIKRLGIGTEQLESQVQQLFPHARLARLDRDTTRRKGALLKILKELRDRTIDILVGTQMVAKGHDYPHITLVGIICADLSLNLPDFRAGERTFQILAQVAGRAGRGRMPGRVILQTYNPTHFSITAAREQDYEMFYRQEIELRKALGYPPVTRMVQIRISGRDKTQVADYARRMAAAGLKIRQHRAFAALDLLGPIEAPLQRIADHYRWQLLIKHPRTDLLHQFVRLLLFGPDGTPGTKGASVTVDVDPLFLM
ncbi:MAG: primosomal protein N' [Desulfobacteraceae bacterium]|nr:MAG: primosomal protein N' [Desulfobacteraceae bacterium]